MNFQAIVKLNQDKLAKYALKGYKIKFVNDEYNYEAVISLGNKSVQIRDGYANGILRNKKSPNITSFDMLLNIDDLTFLNYVSDYPFDEYEERLVEAYELTDSFFQNNFTISEEKYFIFWEKKYLNIDFKNETFHLIAT